MKMNVHKKWNLLCESLTYEDLSDVSFMIVQERLSTAILQIWIIVGYLALVLVSALLP